MNEIANKYLKIFKNPKAIVIVGIVLCRIQLVRSISTNMSMDIVCVENGILCNIGLIFTRLRTYMILLVG